MGSLGEAERRALQASLELAARDSFGLPAAERSAYVGSCLLAELDLGSQPAVPPSPSSPISKADLATLGELLTRSLNVALMRTDVHITRAMADALIGAVTPPPSPPPSFGAGPSTTWIPPELTLQDAPDDPAASVIAEAMPMVIAAASEAASEAAEDEKYLDSTEEAWVDCEAASLDPLLAFDEALGDCPVRFLDARFVIKLAKAGGRLVRRQDLPDGAFFEYTRLRQESYGFGSSSLRVICVFHPWLRPDHPDPKGEALRLLAGVLESFVEDDGGSYAVYLAYCSLLQPGAAGEPCTEAEAALCARAIDGLHGLYSHPATWVVEMTSLPADYPATYSFAAASPFGTPNAAPFALRGWTLAESFTAKLVKDSSQV